MIARVLLTLGVLVYALVVPLLEINATHVFNPDWASHARLHEVWQLSTNSALGLFALWLVWGRQQVRLPALLALFITGGFLFAYTIQGSYGGSMLHSDGSEARMLGMNLGVFGFGLVVAFSLLALWLERHRAQESQ